MEGIWILDASHMGWDFIIVSQSLCVPTCQKIIPSHWSFEVLALRGKVSMSLPIHTINPLSSPTLLPRPPGHNMLRSRNILDGHVYSKFWEDLVSTRGSQNKCQLYLPLQMAHKPVHWELTWSRSQVYPKLPEATGEAVEAVCPRYQWH